MSEHKQIRSRSGATLGVEIDGEGPPIVFVHGTASDVTSWAPVTERLSDHRCLRYDRSGRGDSGDLAEFSLDTEIDDLLAVMALAGQPSHVVAHSYGGLIALAAASRHPDQFATLAVYEAPAHFPGVAFANPETVAALERTLNEEGPEDAIVFFMARFPKVPAAAIENLRAAPGWARRVGAAHTLPRELQVAEHYNPATEIRLPATLPVLLFLGDASPPPFQHSHRHLVELVPQATTCVLEGQAHRAMDAVPVIMADRLRTFCNE